MHTMWKGRISFGLVNIPVKLHAATEDKDVKFRNLHKKCHTPVKYEKVCPRCDEKVANEEIIKGYEYTKGNFVVLDEEELESLASGQKDKAVEIIDFVKITDIDPIYFNRSYYLSPDGGGEKAYSLLRKAMLETGKAGIARIMLRSKEQLAVIRVYEKVLVMETIHYPDEVRKAADVPNIPAAAGLSKKELDTAILLIDQLTTDFNPDDYKDEYREKVLEFIEAKRAGREVVTPDPEEEPQVMDLMAALQASIDRTKPAGKKKTARKTKTTVKAKKKA